MKLKFILGAAGAIAAATLAVAFASDGTFQGVVIKQPFDPAIHGKGPKNSGTQILYHGGPVMHPVAVYVIYYGNVSQTAQTIINDFLSDLNGSTPYGVNTTYSDSLPQISPGPVLPGYAFTQPGASNNSWNGSVFLDNYSQGTRLGTSSTQKIVANALTGVTPDPNGVYLVITSPDVKISGFCTSFCAYHSSSPSIVNGYRIRYALVPDPSQKCTGCNGGIAVFGDTTTPNGDMGADTVTDDIMHELSETVTDPDLNAWYTQSGAENGDLCNYVYEGSPSVLQSATNKDGQTYHYNFTNKGHRYLIQLIWANAGAGYCAAQ